MRTHERAVVKSKGRKVLKRDRKGRAARFPKLVGSRLAASLGRARGCRARPRLAAKRMNLRNATLEIPRANHLTTLLGDECRVDADVDALLEELHRAVGEHGVDAARVEG